MPPEYRQEIAAIVEMLMKQVISNQDDMRKSLGELERKVDVKDAIQEARINAVQEDINNLEKKIDEAIKTVQGVKDEIIQSQEKKYKNTIRAQWAIFGAFGIPAAGYIVTLIFQAIFHH